MYIYVYITSHYISYHYHYHYHYHIILLYMCILTTVKEGVWEFGSLESFLSKKTCFVFLGSSAKFRDMWRKVTKDEAVWWMYNLNIWPPKTVSSVQYTHPYQRGKNSFGPIEDLDKLFSSCYALLARSAEARLILAFEFREDWQAISDFIGWAEAANMEVPRGGGMTEKTWEQNVNMRKWALGQVQHEELGDPDDEIYLYTFRWKDVTWCDLSILLLWASAAQFIGARSTEKRHTLQQGGKACASRCLDGNLNPAAACWWWPHGGPREDHCAPADSWHRDNSERLKADGVSNLMTLEPIGLKHVSSGFLWFEIGCWSIIVWTSTAARLAGKMNQREISWSDPRQVDEPQRSIYCNTKKSQHLPNEPIGHVMSLCCQSSWTAPTYQPRYWFSSSSQAPLQGVSGVRSLWLILWGWWSHCCKTEFTSKSEQWIQAETGLPWWTAVTGRCLE